LNIRDSIVAVLNEKGKIVGTGFPVGEILILICAYVVQVGAIDSDSIQVDSDIESRFVKMRLKVYDNAMFYFKIPRIIGFYNPNWNIALYRNANRTPTIEPVCETKGGFDFDLLLFPHEKFKIECATKIFQALGVDYRVVSDETADWWESESMQGKMV
jgi:restriction endonuclease